MSNAPMTCGRDDGGEPSSPSPRSKVPQPDDRRDGVPAPRRRLTGEKVAEIQRLRPHMERLILGKGMGRVREDLLQEAVLRLVRRWSDPEFAIDRDDGGRAFATTVTLGVIADACRAYDRDRSFPSDTLPESAHTDPETDEYLRIRAVESVLEKALPEKGGLREVAHLWIVVGLGQTEIGRALRINRKTVKRRTDRIRAHLAPHRQTIHDELGFSD
ncbi:sigma-70 family RNA polymerase sigma factor [Streptomyces xinghaiensis]|uniref:RNA polymerase sigma factor n=1 Tax=Streptomyces xinghaiensis TaxID=1038928 RepID=UPI002E1678D2|nr:sigma-70 family RNA polymerase sigma factor [Streptomyces xinghaiensis]